MCAYAIPGYHDLPEKMEKYGGFVLPPSLSVVMFDDDGGHLEKITSVEAFRDNIIPLAIVKSEADSSLIDAYMHEIDMLNTTEDVSV